MISWKPVSHDAVSLPFLPISGANDRLAAADLLR